MPTINQESESPIEEEKYNLYQEFGMDKEQNIIIESLTYEQEVQEQNDIIVNSNDDKQTVINCTQSDEQVQDDNTSDRNIIADEFSLEYAAPHHKIESSNQTPQESIRVDYYDQSMNENEDYKGEESQSDIKHNEQDEKASFIEKEGEYSYDDLYSSSSQYKEELIEEIHPNDYSQNSNGIDERKYFNNTLTNMRIAFGSEQQVRENSVKTLEKMELSNEGSSSDKKQKDSSSIFEKKSFQDFSLKKFTELMHVNNMKEFQTSVQKTFREYNKAQILSLSDKKSANNKSSTPKKGKYISPRK